MRPAALDGLPRRLAPRIPYRATTTDTRRRLLH
jgi:hypothetical protein